MLLGLASTIVANMSRGWWRRACAWSIVAGAAAVPAQARAQGDVKIRDLTTPEGALPVRLVGYGLAVGLDGTGDRGNGSQSAGATVQSVVNMLRRFNVEIPPEVIRMRNVAAVIVTAEVSPFLRAGGRFEVSVSSMGDARSLRGGVLYMTPLVAEPNGAPLATAQGSLLVSDGGSTTRYAVSHETNARIPTGGVLEADLARPVVAATSRLLLREPDLGTASRIADAINTTMGAKTAVVEDEGSVVVTLADTVSRPTAYTKIRELSIRPERAPRLVIDGKDGTVVAGGEMLVGPAVVSHGAITLAIGKETAEDTAPVPGSVRLPAGVSVQRVAASLQAVRTPPSEIGAIFAALREVGAITAEVVIR